MSDIPAFCEVLSGECCCASLEVFVGFLTLFIFYADIGTDIWLAVHYFKKGILSWALPTTACIVTPLILYMILFIVSTTRAKKCWYGVIVIMTIFIGVLPLYTVIGGMGIWVYIYDNMGFGSKESNLVRKRETALAQVIESLLESSPQCILQLYILLNDERLLASQDIGFNIYLSISTSAIAIIWSFFCHEKVMYIMRKVAYSKRPGHPAPGTPANVDDEISKETFKMEPCAELCLLIVKTCECVQRIIAIVLFLSYLSSLLIFLYFMLFHIFLLAFVDSTTYRTNTIPIRSLNPLTCKERTKMFIYCLLASILRTIGYTSVGRVTDDFCRILLHSILVNIENFTFVGLWLLYIPEKLEWLFIPTCAIFGVLFFLQIIFQLLLYITIGKKSSETTDEVFDDIFSVSTSLGFYSRIMPTTNETESVNTTNTNETETVNTPNTNETVTVTDEF